MKWNEIFALFTRPMFQIGQTWISPATILQFVIVGGIVVLFSRLVRRLLRTRVLARTKLEVGLQYAIARIASYVVLVLGFMVGFETIGVDLHSFAFIAGALGGFGARAAGSASAEMALIASTLLLVPGVPATNAQTDIMEGFPTVGSARAVSVAMIMVFATIGIWGAEAVLGLLP
jgi:hypothetical protein